MKSELIFNKKLEGKTIIETLIAFVILLITIGLFLHFIVLMSTKQAGKELKMYNEVKQIAYKIKQNVPIELEDTIKEDYSIEIKLKDMNNDLKLLEIKSIDNNKRELISYKELIIPND
jgi:uncharacterized protein YbaR (Trm112 family)